MSGSLPAGIRMVDLPVQALTAEAFAPFGHVLAAIEDGLPYMDSVVDVSGTLDEAGQAASPVASPLDASSIAAPTLPRDARLHLSAGVPRFYTMRLVHREPILRSITRHRRVTQVLASAGGQPWLIAVAPPIEGDRDDAEPSLESIRAFRIPGDVAIMLARGTWHAGPLFAAPQATFFNLELSDTNLTDHHSCLLIERYHAVLRLVDVAYPPLSPLLSTHRGS